MAITPFTENTAIIASLADLPNDIGGLTAAQLKAKFDLGPTLLKTYVNGTLIPGIEAEIANQLPAPPGSITDTKLSNDPADIKTRFVALQVDVVQRGFNVMSSPFNARGNGITNDAVAIQTAINVISTSYPGATLIFPEGYTFLVGSMADVANRNIFLLKPGVSIDGKGTLKIKNGFGAYENIFKQDSAANPLNDISIKNITIDGNFANNPFSAQPTPFLEARRPFHFSTGENVTFENVILKNVTARHGFITNSINKLTIKNCKFLNWGVSPVYAFDASTIYTAGNDLLITDNLFDGAGICAATAMEIHGQYQKVTGNTVKNFLTGLILVADAVDSVETIIKSNIFHNVCGGIAFWSSVFDTYAANISDNEFYIDNIYQPSPYVDVYGIGTNGATTKNLYDAIICNNIIRFNPTGNFKVRSGPYNAGIQIYPFRNATDVQMIGNIIDSPPNLGISWEILDGSSTGKSKNVLIKNNIIRNPGYTGYAAQSGIWITSCDYFENFIIEENVIYDDRVTPLMQFGILVSSSLTTTDNSPYGLTIKNNKIKGNGQQAVNAANTPLIIGENANWTRGGGIGSAGARVGSTILDTAKDVLYTQVTAPYGTSWKASKRLSLTATPIPGTDTNWTLGVADEIINTSGTIGLPSRWLYNNSVFQACDQVGFRTNAGTPSGVLTPLSTREEVYDTTNTKWYKATGTSNTSWVALN